MKCCKLSCFCLAARPKARTAASVILRGANDFMVDEMERSMHDALMVVKRVLESKTVVPGGGAVEAALSIYLENFASSLVCLILVPLVPQWLWHSFFALIRAKFWKCLCYTDAVLSCYTNAVGFDTELSWAAGYCRVCQFAAGYPEAVDGECGPWFHRARG